MTACTSMNRGHCARASRASSSLAFSTKAGGASAATKNSVWRLSRPGRSDAELCTDSADTSVASWSVDRGDVADADSGCDPFAFDALIGGAGSGVDDACSFGGLLDCGCCCCCVCCCCCFGLTGSAVGPLLRRRVNQGPSELMAHPCGQLQDPPRVLGKFSAGISRKRTLGTHRS